MNAEDGRLVYNYEVEPVLRHSLCILVAFWTAWMTGYWSLPLMVSILSLGRIGWTRDLKLTSITETVVTFTENSNEVEVPLNIRELQMLVMEAMLIVANVAVPVARLSYFKFQDPALFQEQVQDFNSKDGLWFLNSPGTVFRISFQVFVYSYAILVQVNTVINLFNMARTPILRTIWMFETKELMVPVLSILLAYVSIKSLENFMEKTQIVHWFLTATLITFWLFCFLNASLWSRNLLLVRTNDRLGYITIIEATKIQQFFGHILRNLFYCGLLLYTLLIIKQLVGHQTKIEQTFSQLLFVPRIVPTSIPYLAFWAFATIQIARFIKLEYQLVQTTLVLHARNDDALF